VSINGANRLGSNSLPELLVFGARAGKAAAAYAAEQADAGRAALSQAEDEARRLEEAFPGKAGGRERIADLRTEMQRAMEEGAGIYRTEAGLRRAAETLRKLQERLPHLRLDDRSRTFNTERIAALELSCMLDVAETIVHSALQRTESRGAHQRTDHPDRDDGRFLAHSLAVRSTEGPPRIERLPVTITRWPPGQRVYGR
jgi:fumarate reductase flavoprotein subunit